MVETLLQEMSQLSSGDDQWQAKLSVVTENLEHHIKEEEEEIFPKARRKVKTFVDGRLTCLRRRL